ncbi:MAG: nucleotide sugar dehydrogenase, partial [Spirochaetota bacterium]
MVELKEIIKMIETKEAVIGIVGIGYVGLPLAREFLNAGFNVIGFDVDEQKVEKIQNKESYIKHISNDFLEKYITSGKLSASSDFSKIESADIVIICVPTPIGIHYEPNLDFVKNTALEISKYLKRGQIIILESTTYPGTTDEELLPLLENSGMEVGKDFYLGYSPEREDPGNKKYNTKKIPKIVSGITDNCLSLVSCLYSQIIDNIVPVSSTRVAESAKLLENIYRAVNIALVNELKVIFSKMNIDIWEVIDAANTKPFGFQAFYPGPGLGGHCIPIDPFYLSWKSREYEIHT